MTLTAPQPSQPTNTMLRRWDPFREMEEVYERMNQVMQGYFGDRAGTGPGGRLLGSPPADIEETADAYLVELDLPGVRADDLSVELRDGELRVCGEYREREHTGVLRRRARRTGRFEYVVALPGDTDPDRVDAHLGDGVLLVRVDKATASEPRRIPVHS